MIDDAVELYAIDEESWQVDSDHSDEHPFHFGIPMRDEDCERDEHHSRRTSEDQLQVKRSDAVEEIAVTQAIHDNEHVDRHERCQQEGDVDLTMQPHRIDGL